MTRTPPRAALLRRRADLLGEIANIDRELAELEAEPASDADVYSTTGPLPPGRSRRWLRDHAREIPGAVRVGGVRGRSVEWRVRREDYDAWVAAQASPIATAPAKSTPDVDDWLASAGIRLTRRSA